LIHYTKKIFYLSTTIFEHSLLQQWPYSSGIVNIHPLYVIVASEQQSRHFLFNQGASGMPRPTYWKIEVVGWMMEFVGAAMRAAFCYATFVVAAHSVRHVPALGCGIGFNAPYCW